MDNFPPPRAVVPLWIVESSRHEAGRLSRIGVSYTRLHDIELLSIVREFATDFQPPQRAGGRAAAKLAAGPGSIGASRTCSAS